MPIPVTIPRLGWNMEEGTFVEWLKADGETVQMGDRLYRLEGEKSVEEIESFDGGILHIRPDGPRPGDRVAVGTLIGQLLQPGEQPQEFEPSPGNAHSLPASEAFAVQPRTPLSKGELATAITPRARRLAAENGIDVSVIFGSGRDGRIRERDVAKRLSTTSATAAAKLIPHSTTRLAIANRMVESRRTTAPVTLTSIVDVSNLVNLRQQFKAAGQAESRPAPTITDIFVKLAAIALQRHPALAARWTEAGLVPAERINVGVAVDTEAGLLVPVVQDVPSLGLWDLAVRSRELIDRARNGKLTTREMGGGCFTITNLGPFGIDAFTPIINPPESAILGIGRIERRPVMDGDRVIGREQVTLSLTFDHRVVDGAPAARFLQTLATLLANPAAWLTA